MAFASMRPPPTVPARRPVVVDEHPGAGVGGRGAVGVDEDHLDVRAGRAVEIGVVHHARAYDGP